MQNDQNDYTLLPTRPAKLDWDYVNCAGSYFTIGLLVGSLLMSLAFVLAGVGG